MSFLQYYSGRKKSTKRPYMTIHGFNPFQYYRLGHGSRIDTHVSLNRRLCQSLIWRLVNLYFFKFAGRNFSFNSRNSLIHSPDFSLSPKERNESKKLVKKIHQPDSQILSSPSSSTSSSSSSSSFHLREG